MLAHAKKGSASFVPSLERFAEALNEVVGNVVMETLHANMLNQMQRLDRHLIGKVTVTDNVVMRA